MDERIRSDSSQLFFRCYYYFASAVFVAQCISGAGCGCMIESVTIKWVTGSSKLKNNRETMIDGFRKNSLAFEKKYAIISLGNRVFFFVIIE